jgi:hypothetical protein
LSRELRPYQRGMIDWAHATRAGALRACGYAAEMGLGKTGAALHVIDDSLYDFCDTTGWVVVAPRLVAEDGWTREVARWSRLRHLTMRVITLEDLDLEAAVAIEVDGRQIEIPLSRWKAMPEPRPKMWRCGLCLGAREDKAATKKRLLSYTEDVLVVSWQRFPWFVRALGRGYNRDGLVLDESHFVANSTSDVHKAAYHVTHRLGAVKRVLELSGKPGGIEDMHGQMRILDGGARFGATKTAFYEDWMTPDKIDRKRGIIYSHKPREDKADEARALIGELWTSLRSADYLQLPPLVLNPVLVQLGPPARALYARLERDLVVEIEGAEILAPSQAALANKLRQIANGAVYDTDKAWHAVDDAKLDALEEIVDQTDGPIVLAYAFQSDWERIVKRIKGAVHVKSPGSLERFRAGKIKLLGMHPEGGAYGTDGLQDVSSTAVWFGATYVPRQWHQFNARLPRSGQRAARVMLHQILAEGTIEEYVAGKHLPEKIEEHETLLDAIKWRAGVVSYAHPLT